MGDPAAPGRPGSPPPPAWYRDPWRAAPLRWWDGTSWTGFTSAGIAMTQGPVAAAATAVEATQRRRLKIEVLLVLAVFPLPYVVNALAVLIQAALHSGTTGRFPLPISSHVGLSFLIDVLLALEPLAAAALVLYMLWISGEGGSRAVGLDRYHPRTDLALLLPVFLLSFLGPEFAVSLLVRAAHIRAIPVATQSLPHYFAIVGIITAIVAGVVEEIVVLGFLVRRLEQIGLRPAAVVAVAALVRISYHVYYGWGVLPIAAWAVASVLVYRRYRRLAPFIAVHALWDLGLLLVPFYGGGPLGVEVLILAPTTFVFWLLWRKRLPRPAQPPRSGPPWRAR